MTDIGMEHTDPVVQKVSDLIGPVLADLGYELVKVQFRREQHGHVLRIVIYQNSGINVDDCARVSREVAHLLEVEDIIDQAYNLEVTSPGLDWNLITERDFARYIGKKVRIVLRDGAEAVVGLIREVADNLVTLELEGGEQVVIALDLVKKAKLVIEF